MDKLNLSTSQTIINSQSVINSGLIVDNIINTEIKLSLIHGHGLFATKPIKAGMKLTTLDGQIVGFDFYYKVKSLVPISEGLLDYLFMEWNCLSEDKLLARMFRTKYSYINHSRQPNLKLMNNKNPEIWSINDIGIGEELLIDYREEQLPKSYLQGHGSTYL